MKTDFLIIGSGIAGMTAALECSQKGDVVLLSKKKLLSGATPMAQGGIAVSEKDDDGHFDDTMRAGAFLGKESAVRTLVHKSLDALRFLRQHGVVFDDNLHREAGHDRARIFHIADKSGSFMAQKLSVAILNTKNIHVWENAFAVDLLVHNKSVYGASVFYRGKNIALCARRTILASGGGGAIYAKTTTPPEATGDGLAMASRAGAKLSHLEFVQFHPTALDTPESPLFLLSEALRGAGAQLVNADGVPVCDPLQSRDKVARCIFLNGQKGNRIFLDLRHQKNTFWKEHFPHIFSHLHSVALSPEHDLLPIIPAAHFFCGGVVTNLCGETNVSGLFAVGEVAMTGVHGANRLASNSLLEGVVFAREMAAAFSSFPPFLEEKCFPKKFFPKTKEDSSVQKKIQEIAFQYLGIIRSRSGIDRAIDHLLALKPMGTEVSNMREVALLVARAAMKRKENMGGHFWG